eukprot:jgi/Ulvmu1/5315/UM022_0109.1
MVSAMVAAGQRLHLRCERWGRCARRPSRGSQRCPHAAPADHTHLRSAALSLFSLSILSQRPSLAAEDAGAASVSIANLLQSVLSQVDSAGPAGALVFIAAYAIASVLLVPASVLTLGAGALYGPVIGTLVVSAASTTGCTLAFLSSRYLIRPLAEERLNENKLFKALQKRIPERGPKLVLLLRLTPVVPFGLLNYMCGLTTVPLGQYVLASWAGMLPGTAAYVYLGSAGKETLAAAGAGDGMPPLQTAIYGLGALSVLLLTREISKIAQEAVGDLKEE